ALRHRPAATLATIVVLALGIGLVSTMFALADPYLLRPLPYPRPQELVTLSIASRSTTDTAPTLADWAARTDLLAGVAAYGATQPATVSTGDVETSVRFATVSQNFFSLLGVPISLDDWRALDGRTDVPVVLTAATARELFGT